MRLYPRLAVNGIRNNSRIYYPYIGTCIGIIAIYYLVSALHTDEIIRSMKGGNTLSSLMYYARFIIGLFSVMFLFFTSGFISKRRTAEFGLYNVLGMNKRNISIIILIENLIVYLISIVSGTLIGIGLTKFAEAGVGKILKSKVGYDIHISVPSVIETVLLFAFVFGLIILDSLRHITFTGAAQLVKNESIGEKPPRGNVIIALIAIVMLIIAYVIAGDMSGLKSIAYFFIAVLLVIISTYLLFITGFTAACKLMKKSKRYYYNKKHFVSVSSMNFRMKRGGAGLGTICILTTMVLVIMSSTTCYYGGIDRMIDTNFPRDYEIDMKPRENTRSAIIDQRNRLEAFMTQNQDKGTISDPIFVTYSEETMFIEDGELQSLTLSEGSEMSLVMDHFKDLIVLHVVPVEDVSEVMGEEPDIDDGEALVWFSDDYLTVDDLASEHMKSFFPNISSYREIEIDDPEYFFTDTSTRMAHRMVIVVNDYPGVAADLPVFTRSTLFFDSDRSFTYVDEQLVYTFFMSLHNGDDRTDAFLTDFFYREDVREEVYGLYGGLLFMGIMLCIIFLAATVLLMYYRQVVEGYEDRNRFRILRKIGMEKKSIAASINSQILIVFVSPVLLAVLHTIMATPFLMFFMKLQGMWFTDYFIKVLMITFIVFLFVYYLVYKLTSRVYYKIVLG